MKYKKYLIIILSFLLLVVLLTSGCSKPKVRLSKEQLAFIDCTKKISDLNMSQIHFIYLPESEHYIFFESLIGFTYDDTQELENNRYVGRTFYDDPYNNDRMCRAGSEIGENINYLYCMYEKTFPANTDLNGKIIAPAVKYKIRLILKSYKKVDLEATQKFLNDKEKMFVANIVSSECID